MNTKIEGEDVELPDILTCPICGSRSDLWNNSCTWDCDMWYPSKVGVHCIKCGLMLSREVRWRKGVSRVQETARAYALAIATWNRRVPANMKPKEIPGLNKCECGGRPMVEMKGEDCRIVCLKCGASTQWCNSVYSNKHNTWIICG